MCSTPPGDGEAEVSWSKFSWLARVQCADPRSRTVCGLGHTRLSAEVNDLYRRSERGREARLIGYNLLGGAQASSPLRSDPLSTHRSRVPTMKLVISRCLAAGWLASIAWLAGGVAASATRLVPRGTAAEALRGRPQSPRHRPARPRAAFHRAPPNSPRRQAPGTPPVLTPTIRNWPERSPAEYWAPMPSRLPAPRSSSFPMTRSSKRSGPSGP